MAPTPASKAKKSDSCEFYQIRINHELKNEFMQNCKDMALNPSAVMRKLMSQWTKDNTQSKPPVSNTK